MKISSHMCLLTRKNWLNFISGLSFLFSALLYSYFQYLNCIFAKITTCSCGIELSVKGLVERADLQ